jgi:hypothetical protein
LSIAPAVKQRWDELAKRKIARRAEHHDVEGRDRQELRRRIRITHKSPLLDERRTLAAGRQFLQTFDFQNEHGDLPDLASLLSSILGRGQHDGAAKASIVAERGARY